MTIEGVKNTAEYAADQVFLKGLAKFLKDLLRISGFLIGDMCLELRFRFTITPAATNGVCFCNTSADLGLAEEQQTEQSATIP